jgi:phage gp16-like protein
MPATAASDIKLIHIAKQALQMDDATYRGILAAKGNGATSSKQLDAAQRRAVLDHMKACGFTVKAKPGSGAAKANGWARTPEMTKLRALWWALADVGAVTRPATHQACDDAIDAWAVRQLSTATPKLDAVRFASTAQMRTLIEALKQWARRVGAHQVGGSNQVAAKSTRGTLAASTPVGHG